MSVYLFSIENIGLLWLLVFMAKKDNPALLGVAVDQGSNDPLSSCENKNDNGLHALKFYKTKLISLTSSELKEEIRLCNRRNFSSSTPKLGI